MAISRASTSSIFNGSPKLTSFSSNPQYNTTLSVEYLVVAGGGGGGGGFQSPGGGGGGAGGMRTGTLSLNLSTNYTVTVGSGGTRGFGDQNSSSGYIAPTNGADSVFSTITSTGGGRGGVYAPSNTSNTGSGGSGGGGSYGSSAGTGITGQGNNGANAGQTDSQNGAGGGGAGGVGGSPGGSNNTAAGAGGIGLVSSNWNSYLLCRRRRRWTWL